MSKKHAALQIRQASEELFFDVGEDLGQNIMGQPWQSPGDTVEVNGIWLSDGQNQALILSIDCMFVPPALSQRLRTEVLTSHGFSEEEIFIVATHAHSVPGLDPSKAPLGLAPAPVRERINDQLEKFVSELMVQPVRQGYLRHGNASADHSINRRKRGWSLVDGRLKRTVRLAPDRQGAKDETVSVLMFSDEAGEPLVFLWNYACHPVIHPDRTAVSSGFPGRVRTYIRNQVGRDIPLLYLQGFSGNVRPNSIKKPGNLKDLAHLLLNGQQFGPMNWNRYERWTNSLAECVLSACRDASEISEPEIRTKLTSMPLSELLEGSAPQKNVIFRRLQIGGNINLIAVSAEVMVQYKQKTGEALDIPLDKLLCVGCCDDSFGYLPTDQIVAEGGYEAEGFMPYFGLEAEFRQGLESRVMASIKALQ